VADWEQDVPAGVDTSTPNIARVYDYILGGKDNFECDRALAAQLRTVIPEISPMATQNRAFLGRVVRFLAEQGIDQFLDIGTGLPTQQNVHEVAQSVLPQARVVYVDNDPVVLVHARALLADNPNTIVVEGDLRRPAEFLADDNLRALIDFDRPIAVLLLGILYFLPEEDKPYELVAQLRDAMAPGSYLAISHVVSEDRPEAFSTASQIYGPAIGRPGDPTYTRESVRAYFDDMDMVEPGLVYVRDWRNEEPDSPQTWMLGGVARKT
jgi:O-methyltransferase involved in polyketide biosynthesis